MKPDFDKLGAEFESSSSVNIVDVDCTKEQDLCGKVIALNPELIGCAARSSRLSNRQVLEGRRATGLQVRCVGSSGAELLCAALDAPLTQ